jgi:hypothetical protein
LTWHFVGRLLVEHADTPFPALRTAVLEPVILWICHLERDMLSKPDLEPNGGGKWGTIKARYKGRSTKVSLEAQEAGKTRSGQYKT